MITLHPPGLSQLIPYVKLSQYANFISSATLIPLCHVTYHIHPLWGLGCGRLWGTIILPATGGDINKCDFKKYLFK